MKENKCKRVAFRHQTFKYKRRVNPVKITLKIKERRRKKTGYHSIKKINDENHVR
jgi:hypothetical protein